MRLGAAVEARVKGELEQISRRLRPALVAFFLKRLRNHAEAEDLTQEVLLRLASMDTADLQSADAYVFRMAANLLSDRARKNNVRQRYATEQMNAELTGVDPLDPYRIASGRRALASLAERLAELPERTRAVFVLYRIENMNKRAIAEAFGISVSSVEKDVGRAMAHLMLLEEDGE